MSKTYKCTYKHCKHDNCMLTKEESIKISNKYYHIDCANDILNIREINQLYRDNISDTVVPIVIGRVINDIVFGKNVSSEFLLYAIKYAIYNKLNITSPYGLHYLIDNKRVKDNYKKSKAKEILRNTDIKHVEIEKEEVVNYKLSEQKVDTWSNVLFK